MQRATAVVHNGQRMSQARWKLLGLLFVLVALAAVARPAAASAELTEAETAHLPEIVQWAYRTSAVKDPLPCEAVCNALWAAAAEHPGSAGEEEGLWDEIARLEMGLGMWGTLESLRSQLGGVALASTPLRVGWEINNGSSEAGRKWMEIVGPTAPAGLCGGESTANLRLEGESVGVSAFEKPIAARNSWLLEGCIGLGEDVSEYVKEVVKPAGPCAPFLQDPRVYGGWVRTDFHWNQCGEEIGKEVPEVPMYASIYRSRFRFRPVVDWEHQHLEGPGTKNVETHSATDPGEAAVIAAVTAALERGGPLRALVDWAISGPLGPNPLGPVPREGGVPRKHSCFSGKPVNCANGNEMETQSDLSVGGRGPALRLARTYNSQLAREQSEPGPFGYGWTSSYSTHLQVNAESGMVTVTEDDASVVRFVPTEGQLKPLGALVQATLAHEGSEYVYTLPDQTTLRFNGSGRLLSETDRNGNALTMAYGSGNLETITDSAGRKITLAYNGEGEIESAKDPMGHVVKYAYEGGNLASVTEPGEESPRWQFKYDSSHELTKQTDAKGHAVVNEYDGSGRVIKQTDALSRKREWEYKGSESAPETKITEPNGSVTIEKFNDLDEPTSVSRAHGTEAESTSSYDYDGAGELVGATDPNGHRTTYEYDEAGDLTGEQNADGDTREWTYNAKHETTSLTSPRLETTTVERDGHGNATELSRRAPGGETQVTKFKYAANGDLESSEDSLKRTSKYEYDSYGDRTAEIDPEGDERTWGYDADSEVTSTVSPRGHVTGAKESKFTTSVERDAQERPVKVTDALKHETKYKYDANGNLESETDPLGNVTSYSYDADDEPTADKQPSGTSETEYDSEGRVIAQIDGNKHSTKYKRNALGEVTEVEDPLGRKKLQEYDAAGNLKKLTDAAKRTRKYTYDPANRLTEIDYSSEATPDVKYEYDADGNRTKMVDGTGSSEYVYDQLDRLIESKDGHGEAVGYEYDLDGELTKITYPGAKAVLRTFDKAGRLQSVTDWLEHTTKFGYDADSEQTSTTFPAGTSDADQYAYEADGAMESVTMKKGEEVLASIEYTRNKDLQVLKATTKGLPGEEKPAFSYDEDGRLSKGAGIKYGYDAADNATTIGGNAYAYDAADQLEKSEAKKATVATYSFDELGQRTKTKPATGPATSYGYDQAGDLTSVARPHEGEVAAIEDSYGYDGDGLRASQTISGSTSYMTWDVAESLPLLLGDGTSVFLYGPAGLPIEQVSGETAQYLHHDQQGSTRMITGAAGTVAGTITFDACGNKLGGTGSATSVLGYDGEYTSADTGLVYLRARTYDPATAQFVSRDPLSPLTLQPYTYANADPEGLVDPSGLLFGIPGTPSTSEVVSTIGQVAGGIATVTSVIAAGCAVVAAPTVVGEAACGAVGSVSLVAGGVATAADTYNAATGTGSPAAVVFDSLALGAGVGGEAFEGLIGNAELGAYAKTYGSLLSAAGYGAPLAEGVALGAGC
ncbi:MAG TPA: DUF6531 domain-containing protein [Solirubrobacteraceae bacterium]|nr:DUF6531 domain-containing protein [Solirubrobacteraceae bacterium]